MSELKPRRDLLADLRCTMAGFVGQTFTEEMRQIIRMDMREALNEVRDLCADIWKE